MPSFHLAIFDDGRGDFGPLTDLRPAFELRTGAETTRRRLEHVAGQPAEALWTPPALQLLTQAADPRVPVNAPLPAGDWLAVNGRWVVQQEDALAPVREAWSAGSKRGCARSAGGELILAWGPASEVTALLQSPGTGDLQDATIVTLAPPQAQLYARPWHVLDHLEKTLSFDLTSDALPRADSAVIHPSAVIDESHGPVVIDEHAVVGPLCILEGPCYLGPHAQLAGHTYLRSNSVIGPWCKMAGEISFSIVQGYSNKAHYGFLGHALLGQWVNLGAGTTVSNLKNTYGSVRMQLREGSPAEDSGRTFLGPILGDYVRTAIGTMIPTGSVLHTGAMIAAGGFAPKLAKPFGFYTDKKIEPAEKDKFLATARAMMKRRNVALSQVQENRLCELMGGWKG